MPLTEDQRALLGCIGAGQIDNVRSYLSFFPPPASIEYEDEEAETLALTPIITAVYCKHQAITDLLVANGANLCRVTAVGANALSTALRVGDEKMVERLRPLFQEKVWGGAEDRMLVEIVQSLLDDYYPASSAKADSEIRDYRAMLVPKLQRYRTQITPLTQADKEYLQKEKAEFEVLLKEREHHRLRFKMLASQIPDEKEREAFIQAAIEARRKELREKSEAEREKAALAKKAAELEKKAQALQAELEAARREQQAHAQRVEQVGERHAELAQRVGAVEKKVELLWDEHEAEADVKAQKQHIRQDEVLQPFYHGTKGHIHDFFVGRQAARSGEVVVQGPSELAKNALSLAGDIIPLPGAGVLKIVGQAVYLYQRYKKGQRDAQVDHGLAGVASDSVEFNEVVEPASRQLTWMGAHQLRRFGPSERAKLTERAAQLMIIYLVFEDHSHTSYSDLIQQLIMAVRVIGLQGVKIKDIHGKTLKSRNLATLTGEVLSESQVFSLFDMKVTSSPRPALTPPPPSPPPTPRPPLGPRPEEQKKKPAPVSGPSLEGMSGGVSMGSRPASPPPQPVGVVVVAVAASSRSKSPAPRSRAKSPAPGLPMITPQPQPVPSAALHPPAAPVSRNLVLQRGGAQPGRSQALGSSPALTVME